MSKSKRISLVVKAYWHETIKKYAEHYEITISEAYRDCLLKGINEIQRETESPLSKVVLCVKLLSNLDLDIFNPGTLLK